MNTLPRDTDGKLSTWAWPGGYPIFYLDAHDDTLCPACAREDDAAGDTPRAADCNWENPDIYCDNCGDHISSAYGPDEPTPCSDCEGIGGHIRGCPSGRH